MERTLAIIKPNAVAKNWIGRILTLIEEDGLKVVAARMKMLSRPEVEGFYAEHRGKPFFEGLINFMTSGTVVLMVLEAEGAIEKFRKLMGDTDPAKAAPQTIRNLYGDTYQRNSIHGSDSPTSAQREIEYFFADEFRPDSGNTL